MCRLRLQPITCTIVIFGMFIGQRSTLGNGLSGEPWMWQDSPKASPRLFSNEKNVIEQVKLLFQWMLIERWQGPVCWVQCANMWQDCSLTGVQRKTAFVEQSWWPEFDMFGSMPSCAFPRQKLLPRLAQQNCHTAAWIYPWKNAYYSGQHPCFGPNWFIQFCNTWRWIRYA